MNILIAEDEQDIRNLLELHLLKEGYTVFKACKWIRSLRYLKKRTHTFSLIRCYDGWNRWL